MARRSSKGRYRPLSHARLPALAPLFTALTLALPGLAQAAGALPHGGQFVAGAGSITGNATTVTINQASSRGIIDWNSFSIGSGNRVAIANGNGATLNRVTGANPTLILGALSATGSLYLVNPQGIVVGRDGVVSTGGRFVASTLDVDNAGFMNGGTLTFSKPSISGGASSGVVINNGNIGSTGGDVILIASNEIDNVGTLSAPNGTVELGVGQKVTLQDSTVGQQIVVVGDGGKIANRGTIEAAQINLQADDGNIFALAGNHSVLRATGTAVRDGHVWLVAGNGRVWLDGTVQASNADGSGGTVDTDAVDARIAGGPIVQAKQWNITTDAFTADALTAPVLQSNLDRGTSIDINASDWTRDIDVASSIDWSGTASLTLTSARSLTLEKGVTIRNSGGGNLELRADSGARDIGGGIVNNGTIDWSASNGYVRMFYDMNGTYSPGKQLTNPLWYPGSLSGLLTQFTAYQLVNSDTDLNQVSNNLAGNYALGQDIGISDRFYQIGDTLDPFTGQFDGEGHTISGLNLAVEDMGAQEMMVGLFTYIGEGAIVHDLNLRGSAVLEASAFAFNPLRDTIGLLAGYNAGTILRVNVSGTVQTKGFGYDGDFSVAGGLVGTNAGTGVIWRSSSNVAATGGGTVGGLAGENDGTVSESFATGPVQTIEYAGTKGAVSEGRPGGLVGYNAGEIDDSYATGAVTNECAVASCSAGGLVYMNGPAGRISQSFATGPVTGGKWINGDGVPVAPQNFGIAAENDAMPSVGVITNDVYWNKDTTGAQVGVGLGTPISNANGLTTAQMTNPASFSGWDFSATGEWALPAGGSHPILRWQLDPTEGAAQSVGDVRRSSAAAADEVGARASIGDNR
ncbi:filamentous hemagglutinin N-terminal domain-containing protein [Trinickia diaoshuihuensis]|uniref:two-partner secretion domain-containing protein n=1 Tax=Trinickia diaoshuihuensis TaxID=2292265 RepID=UPI001F079121|nr:filamentous hemagglutinin N-terminal domain-containing protein [Trinickia diaoshuihuensis]